MNLCMCIFIVVFTYDNGTYTYFPDFNDNFSSSIGATMLTENNYLGTFLLWIMNGNNLKSFEGRREPTSSESMKDVRSYSHVTKAVFKGWSGDGNVFGIGQLIWKNGDKYEGSFRDGQMFGHGKYYYAIGDLYIGEFLNGKEDGLGVLKYKNGDVFEGFWKNGMKNGKGKMTYKNTKVEKGVWKNNKLMS